MSGSNHFQVSQWLYPPSEKCSGTISLPMCLSTLPNTFQKQKASPDTYQHSMWTLDQQKCESNQGLDFLLNHQHLEQSTPSGQHHRPMFQARNHDNTLVSPIQVAMLSAQTPTPPVVDSALRVHANEVSVYCWINRQHLNKESPKITQNTGTSGSDGEAQLLSPPESELVDTVS